MSNDLEDNMLILKIPKFIVNYDKNKHYSCSVEEEKAELKRILTDASGGYCMYCYRRIVIDGVNYGHLEHAIEKNNSDKLIDCVPNIGIACPKCNTSYKKRGEQKRKLPGCKVEEFNKTVCKENCTNACASYENIRQEYIENQQAQIILQPLGVRGMDCKEELRIEYDILEGIFKPSENSKYTAREKEFIQRHIDRFHLNDKVTKTEQLIKFLEDTINRNGEYTQVEYNNLIVKLFVKKLQGKSQDEIFKICSTIYEYAVTKFHR